MSVLLKSSTRFMIYTTSTTSKFAFLLPPTCNSLLKFAILGSDLGRCGFSAHKKDDNPFKPELMKEILNEGAEPKKEPKYRGKTEDYKNKIYLKDMTGRMLGLKTRQEAQLLAKKHKLVLVEDDSTKKIPTLRLSNPRGDVHKVDEVLLDEQDSASFEGTFSESESSDSDQAKKSGGTDHQTPKMRNHPHKHLIFNSKLTEHDLQVKMNQVKKWVARGQETLIRVNTVGPGDSAKLILIDKEFDRIFNNPSVVGTKINQRRLSEKELRLNIVPVDLGLIAKMVEADGIQSGAIDLDKVNPNDLLKDENILDKLAESSSSSSSSSEDESTKKKN